MRSIVKVTGWCYLLAIVVGTGLGFILPVGNVFLKDTVDFFTRVYQVPVIPFIVVSVIYCLAKLDRVSIKKLAIALLLLVFSIWLIGDLLVISVSALFHQLAKPYLMVLN